MGYWINESGEKFEQILSIPFMGYKRKNIAYYVMKKPTFNSLYGILCHIKYLNEKLFTFNSLYGIQAKYNFAKQ